jgi:hypothetical protein
MYRGLETVQLSLICTVVEAFQPISVQEIDYNDIR